MRELIGMESEIGDMLNSKLKEITHELSPRLQVAADKIANYELQFNSRLEKLDPLIGLASLTVIHIHNPPQSDSGSQCRLR